MKWDLLEIIFSLLLVHISNHVVGKELSKTVVFPENINIFFKNINEIIYGVFFLILILIVISWRSHKRLLVNRCITIYLSLVTLQLIVNVLLLVSRAHENRGQPLYMLWDVAALYGMNIIVFSFWYLLVDSTVPGGAFIFPVKEGNNKLHWIDYLFLSFNTCTTFGPTSEQVVSKRAKVLMMVQTLLSLIITVVLAARAVGGL
ncbi:MAG: hypothetical protein ABRQ39_15690 [Candidatus Eremiobacterota bacterium]